MINLKKVMEEQEAMRLGRRCHRVLPRASEPAPEVNCLVGSEFGVCARSTAKPITEWSLLEANPSRYARLLTHVQIEVLLSIYQKGKRSMAYGAGSDEAIIHRLSGKLDGKSYSRQERPTLVERRVRAGNWFVVLTPLGERVAAEFLCLIPVAKLAVSS